MKENNIWERRAHVRAWQEKKAYREIRDAVFTVCSAIGIIAWSIILLYAMIGAVFGE